MHPLPTLQINEPVPQVIEKGCKPVLLRCFLETFDGLRQIDFPPPEKFALGAVYYVFLTWRLVEPKVVRNQGEKPVCDVMKLDLGPGLVPHHVQRLGQDLVGRLDLFPAQLAQGHLLRVDFKLYHRFLHLLNVEN